MCATVNGNVVVDIGLLRLPAMEGSLTEAAMHESVPCGWVAKRGKLRGPMTEFPDVGVDWLTSEEVIVPAHYEKSYARTDDEEKPTDVDNRLLYFGGRIPRAFVCGPEWCALEICQGERVEFGDILRHQDTALVLMDSSERLCRSSRLVVHESP
jgi:hypothetical protein